MLKPAEPREACRNSAAPVIEESNHLWKQENLPTHKINRELVFFAPFDFNPSENTTVGCFYIFPLEW